MLIQNISNTAQAPQPARLTSDSAPVVVPAAATPAAPVESPVAKAEQQPSSAQLQNVVDSINKTLTQANKNIQFSVDSDTKKTVIKLMDTETGDVIRQYPSKEALAISQSIDQIQQGLLLKQKA
jgi:flagellar protein FlaG